MISTSTLRRFDGLKSPQALWALRSNQGHDAFASVRPAAGSGFSGAAGADRRADELPGKDSYGFAPGRERERRIGEGIQ